MKVVVFRVEVLVQLHQHGRSYQGLRYHLETSKRGAGSMPLSPGEDREGYEGQSPPMEGLRKERRNEGDGILTRGR